MQQPTNQLADIGRINAVSLGAITTKCTLAVYCTGRSPPAYGLPLERLVLRANALLKTCSTITGAGLSKVCQRTSTIWYLRSCLNEAKDGRNDSMRLTKLALWHSACQLLSCHMSARSATKVENWVHALNLDCREPFNWNACWALESWDSRCWWWPVRLSVFVHCFKERNFSLVLIKPMKFFKGFRRRCARCSMRFIVSPLVASNLRSPAASRISIKVAQCSVDTWAPNPSDSKPASRWLNSLPAGSSFPLPSSSHFSLHNASLLRLKKQKHVYTIIHYYTLQISEDAIWRIEKYDV